MADEVWIKHATGFTAVGGFADKKQILKPVVTTRQFVKSLFFVIYFCFFLRFVAFQ
jgi:hypothetical protein